MKDAPLIEKRLSHIVETVERIRRLARPSLFDTDLVQLGFVERNLQTAIQAMLDVAATIVANHHLGAPSTNAALFDLLAQTGWMTADRAPVFRRIVGFRNILVHRYVEIDVGIIRSIVDRHLEDLLDFVRLVRARTVA